MSGPGPRFRVWSFGDSYSTCPGATGVFRAYHLFGLCSLTSFSIHSRSAFK